MGRATECLQSTAEKYSLPPVLVRILTNSFCFQESKRMVREKSETKRGTELTPRPILMKPRGIKPWRKVSLKGLCHAIFLLKFPVLLFLRAINSNMWMEYSFNDGILLTQQTQMISKHSFLSLVYLKNVGPSFFRYLLSNFDHPHFRCGFLVFLVMFSMVWNISGFNIF